MPEFQFASFTDFLMMDGYARYVWSVYIIFAFFIVINVIPVLRTRRKIIKQLQASAQRNVSSDSKHL
jgi:heme exporter protein CcmD